MNVVIVDYGMCNLGSVRRSFEECGARAVISGDRKLVESAERLVLPGVGSFKDGMDHLRSMGLAEPIVEAARQKKIPVLGICLGMQLLADQGREGGDTEGLGLIAGKVEKLQAPDSETRIPHVGWNEVYPTKENLLFADIPNASDFYFVHSYHFVAARSSAIAATTPYCGGFTSVVAQDNVVGTQFHPEKSSKLGFQLIKNFLKM